MFKLNSFKLSKLSLVLLPCFMLAMQGCSIEQIASEELKIETPEDLLISTVDLSDPRAHFLVECNKCIQGDLSNLPWIIQTYHSSYTASNNFKPGQFLYQYVVPTQMYEKCAEKANAMGDNSAMSQLIVRPARTARISRYFYVQKEYAQGAFWLQRLINIYGEKDGLYTAGRIFIQDIRTISIGVRLLEQSARLGNREARQLLLGLMQPGSSYYQAITQNVLLEEERSADNEKDYQNAAEQAQDQAEQAQKLAQEQSQLTADQELEALTTDEAAAGVTDSSIEELIEASSDDPSQVVSISNELSSEPNAASAPAQATKKDKAQDTAGTAAQVRNRSANAQKVSTSMPATRQASEQVYQSLEADQNALPEPINEIGNDRERDSEAITRESTVYEPNPATTAAEKAQERMRNPNYAPTNTTETTVPLPAHNVPMQKLNERSEQIEELKAKAAAAAAAAEQHSKTNTKQPQAQGQTNQQPQGSTQSTPQSQP